MSEIKTDFIQKVIDIMKNNEITEVSLEDEEQSLYIRKDGFTSTVEQKPIKEVKSPIKQDDEQKKESKKLVPIVSNMIGIYFSKPSPGEKPFVQVGDKIKAGQTICIIETIKLMNKITSDVSGTVKEICIEDSKPVEYGQTIMYIEQD